MKPTATIVPSRPEVAAVKRKTLTDKWDFAELLRRQKWRCMGAKYGILSSTNEADIHACFAELKRGNCHVDHIIPLACGGTNDLSNLQILCADCHKIKTDTKDKKDAAKIKRQRGEKGQQARRKARGSSLIKGRGFDRTLRKRMDGKVEKR